MITIQLTPQETVVLYALMEKMLQQVNDSTDLELINRDKAISLIESIMGKVADQLGDQSINN